MKRDNHQQFTHQNAYLVHQNQQAYLVYCHQVMMCLQALLWLQALAELEKQANFKEKTTSGPEKLTPKPHQQNSQLKSLKQQGKTEAKNKVALDATYDSNTGRFLREDPFDGDVNTPPSLHRYLYANSNPNFYTDPTGLVATIDEGDLEELGTSITQNKPLDNPSSSVTAILESNGMSNQIQQREIWGGNSARNVSYISPNTSAMVAQIIANSSTSDHLSELVVVEEGDDQSTVLNEINDRLGDYSNKESVRYSVAQKTNTLQAGQIIDISSLVIAANNARNQSMIMSSTVEHARLNDDAPLLIKALTAIPRFGVGLVAESEKALKNNSVTGFFVGQAPRNQRNSANIDATIGSLFAGLKAGKSAFNSLNQISESTILKNEALKVYKQSFNSKNDLVIGRLADTQAGAELGFTRLNNPVWNLQINDAWVQGGIDAKKRFFLGSNINDINLRNPGNRAKVPKDRRPTVYFRELKQLRDAKYRRVGDYMVPPQ